MKFDLYNLSVLFLGKTLETLKWKFSWRAWTISIYYAPAPNRRGD